MDRTRNAVNRFVLLAGGCTLLGAATAVLTATTGVGAALPPWAARVRGGSLRWIEPATRTTAVLVLSALAAAGLLLLLLQLRRRTLGRLPLETRHSTVDGRAVTAAVSGRLLALPGVTTARTTLHGPVAKARLRTRIVVDDTASPERILRALATATLPEVHSVLTPRSLPVRARFTVRGPRRLG
ncbi:hypothetical protein [Streptomyces sp. NPDC002104]